VNAASLETHFMSDWEFLLLDLSQWAVSVPQFWTLHLIRL